jgi:hypothetical protein
MLNGLGERGKLGSRIEFPSKSFEFVTVGGNTITKKLT